MILTGKQIVDLAMFAGLSVEHKMLDEDELETEISIIEKNGKIYAYYTEYPEEGAMELG